MLVNIYMFNLCRENSIANEFRVMGGWHMQWYDGTCGDMVVYWDFSVSSGPLSPSLGIRTLKLRCWWDFWDLTLIRPGPGSELDNIVKRGRQAVTSFGFLDYNKTLPCVLADNIALSGSTLQFCHTATLLFNSAISHSTILTLIPCQLKYARAWLRLRMKYVLQRKVMNAGFKVLQQN